MLRLKDPDRLPGGLRLEVCPERFFFDRATPLRWVVSSLRSVSAEYPHPQQTQQQQQRQNQQQRHQQNQQQPLYFGGPSSGHRHTDQSYQGSSSRLGLHRDLSESPERTNGQMEQERIPKCVSYLFLSVREDANCSLKPCFSGHFLAYANGIDVGYIRIRHCLHLQSFSSTLFFGSGCRHITSRFMCSSAYLWEKPSARFLDCSIPCYLTPGSSTFRIRHSFCVLSVLECRLVLLVNVLLWVYFFFSVFPGVDLLYTLSDLSCSSSGSFVRRS